MRRIPHSPALLIAAANAFVGIGGDASIARPRGQSALASEFLRGVGIETDPMTDGSDHVAWHTAFVHHIGYWSHYDQETDESSWPLPASPSAEQLGAFANDHGLLSSEPEPGDLFLLWGPAKRAFVRSGIVVSVEGSGFTWKGKACHHCAVIEGNTNEGRSATGGLTLRHLRRLSAAHGDTFVRWYEIDERKPRASAATPMENGAIASATSDGELRRAA